MVFTSPVYPTVQEALWEYQECMTNKEHTTHLFWALGASCTIDPVMPLQTDCLFIGPDQCLLFVLTLKNEKFLFEIYMYIHGTKL